MSITRCITCETIFDSDYNDAHAMEEGDYCEELTDLELYREQEIRAMRGNDWNNMMSAMSRVIESAGKYKSLELEPHDQLHYEREPQPLSKEPLPF